MTALEMFERNELDWLGGHMSSIPPDALPSLGARLQYYPIAASTFCSFNTEKAPFSNELIRSLQLSHRSRRDCQGNSSHRSAAGHKVYPALFVRREKSDPIPLISSPASQRFIGKRACRNQCIWRRSSPVYAHCDHSVSARRH